MRKIFLLMNVSLDGYFEGPAHDISWANSQFEPFSTEESEEVDTFLFGHRTYDMMKSFWPTPEAEQLQPEVARVMNANRKLVSSRKSFDPGWNNVQVVSGDVPAEILALKQQPGKTIAIFGSNMLSVSLLAAGLLDEVRLVVNPVVIGAGTPLFAGLPAGFTFHLQESRPFPSGAVMLIYTPALNPDDAK